jgi:hypothetical protein
MAVRIEKIVATVLDEAHRRQPRRGPQAAAEEAVEALAEEPEELDNL